MRVIEAMFLKPLDQIVGYGVVSSVEPLHHICCQRTNFCGGLCRGDPRVRVRINGEADEFIWSALSEFEIFRPEPAAEFRSDLLEDDRL